MEKKSFAIGGAIGTAVGMVAMLGIALGVGSCANKDKVKNFQEEHVLVQRPKMTKVEGSVEVYRVNTGGTFTGDYSALASSGTVSYLSYKTASGYDPNVGASVTYLDAVSISWSWHMEGSVYAGNFTNAGSLRGESSPYTFYPNQNGLYISVEHSGEGTMDDLFDSLTSDRTRGMLSLDGNDLVFEELPDPEPTPSGGLVSDIFAQVTASITNFAQALGNSVTESVKLFYVDGNWTPLGILSLVSAGIALVYWCFYLIKKLLNIGVK